MSEGQKAEGKVVAVTVATHSEKECCEFMSHVSSSLRLSRKR